MLKLWSYLHFTGSGNRSRTATESSTCTSYSEVPATEPGTGSGPVTEPGTGFNWWFRYRCEIQFRSGPSIDHSPENDVFYTSV